VRETIRRSSWVEKVIVQPRRTLGEWDEPQASCGVCDCPPQFLVSVGVSEGEKHRDGKARTRTESRPLELTRVSTGGSGRCSHQKRREEVSPSSCLTHLRHEAGCHHDGRIGELNTSLRRFSVPLSAVEPILGEPSWGLGVHWNESTLGSG